MIVFTFIHLYFCNDHLNITLQTRQRYSAVMYYQLPVSILTYCFDICSSQDEIKMRWGKGKNIEWKACSCKSCRKVQGLRETREQLEIMAGWSLRHLLILMMMTEIIIIIMALQSLHSSSGKPVNILQLHYNYSQCLLTITTTSSDDQQTSICPLWLWWWAWQWIKTVSVMMMVMMKGAVWLTNSIHRWWWVRQWIKTI